MKRLFPPGTVFVSCLLLVLAAAPAVFCLEAGDLALWPGDLRPAPLQRGWNEVEALPHRDAACPVCRRVVAIPEVDKLMRRPAAAGGAVKWRMDAASRDADTAPYPGPGKVAFQADIAVCPDCGYAAPAERFAAPVADETAAWARAVLRPSLRGIQAALLGDRADDMREDEIIDFFSRQEEIPDSVRTEHYRVAAAAIGAPLLEQAEATWLAAWSLRRESAGAPRGGFLARRAAACEAMAGADAAASEPADRERALRRLLGRIRSGTERANAGDRLAARLLIAGVHIRAGRLGEATLELEALRDECRERFLRPEQDPLWSAAAKASRAVRMSELEAIRGEAEREIAVRIDLVKSERDLLDRAANLIREAMLKGELDGEPDRALFHAYLVGEFLRRAGHLALATEWFKNLGQLAPEGSGLAAAAGIQLAEVREQAGETVNLLSALGHDGEALIKLREICAESPGG